MRQRRGGILIAFLNIAPSSRYRRSLSDTSSSLLGFRRAAPRPRMGTGLGGFVPGLAKDILGSEARVFTVGTSPSQRSTTRPR